MKPEQEPKDDVMTTEEVAALLRVNPITVQRWTTKRGLPAAKVGTTTRYRKAAVLEWLAEHEQRQGQGNE